MLTRYGSKTNGMRYILHKQIYEDKWITNRSILFQFLNLDLWTCLMQVKKANPEAEFKDISNILGAKWKTVSPEEKKPYEEKYLAEKEAYLQVITKEKRESEAMKLLEEEQKQKTAMELLEQYMQFKQETEKENKNKKKKEKDPLKPKHPLSAYFLFTNDRRASILADNKGILEVIEIICLFLVYHEARATSCFWRLCRLVCVKVCVKVYLALHALAA